jgi:N-glycosylase/DNA lyase
MQQVWVGFGETARLLTLPPGDEELMPGVRWGCPSIPFSPAYWAARCAWPSDAIPQFVVRDGSLAEEVGFCLLGGYGIRYEMNALAFERLKGEGAFDLGHACPEPYLAELLLEPFDVGGRAVRYRFPRQRARRIAGMRSTLETRDLLSLPPLALRSALQSLDGVGPKTASWVVRNLLGSDDVAILDVHIVRVCQFIGLFPTRINLPHDYPMLEELFLSFARKTDIRPSVLDAVMWAEARTVPAYRLRVDSDHPLSDLTHTVRRKHGRSIKSDSPTVVWHSAG